MCKTFSLDSRFSLVLVSSSCEFTRSCWICVRRFSRARASSLDCDEGKIKLASRCANRRQTSGLRTFHSHHSQRFFVDTTMDTEVECSHSTLSNKPLVGLTAKVSNGSGHWLAVRNAQPNCFRAHQCGPTELQLRRILVASTRPHRFAICGYPFGSEEVRKFSRSDSPDGRALICLHPFTLVQLRPLSFVHFRSPALRLVDPHNPIFLEFTFSTLRFASLSCASAASARSTALSFSILIDCIFFLIGSILMAAVWLPGHTTKNNGENR